VRSFAILTGCWTLLLAATFPIEISAQSSPAATGSQSASVSVALQRHTIIPVVIKKDIRVGGAGNDQGQTKTLKDLEVAQDVIVGGFIIARKGDLVEGHLTTSKNITKRVFSADVSQEAALDVDDVVNFCGDTIHMMFERTYVGGVRGGVMSFGPHAHDAVFAKGQVLKAQTDRLEKSVCGERTAAEPLPLPTDMVVSDEEADTTK
jgi:hypothetical protein